MDFSNPTISPVAISSITANNADLAFTTSENCNHSIIYGFAVNSMPSSLTSNTFTTAHITTFNTLLTYNRAYYLNITVWDNAGNSAESITYSFTTLDKPPVGGSEGGSSTGFDEEEEEEEEEPATVEPTIVYVNTTDTSLAEKILALITLRQQTGFPADENFASQTYQFNSFIMNIRTRKEWKVNKGSTVYITITDLNENKKDAEKIAVALRNGDGNLLDSADEVKKLSLGSYIAILKSDEIGDVVIEATAIHEGEEGSGVVSVTVEETEVSILTKIWNFLQRIWASLTKFKIVSPSSNSSD